MKVLATAAIALLGAGACASPVPTLPTNSPAAEPIPAASILPLPSPTDLMVSWTGASVRFNGWTAGCSDVQTDVCGCVARLFANNLARSWKAVFDASGGWILVEGRSSCPPSLPDWADAASCWQATAHARTGDVCMVVARQSSLDRTDSTFGQVGGDDMTGRFGGPPSGWPVCE